MNRTPGLVVSFTVLLSLIASVATAAPLDCERALAKDSTKFVRAALKAQRKCFDAVVKNASNGPCPDARASAKIAQVAAKLRSHVSQRCGGADKNCGVGGDDIPLSAIGWTVGTCPNFEQGACTNTIGDCSDVSECVLCVDRAAVDQAIDLYYGSANLSTTNATVIGCQRAIGKAGEKFFSTKAKALQRCEDRVLLGIQNGPCPDAATAAKIARAEDQKIATICRACGGPDETCGTADDIPPSIFGFAPSCPNVTVPGGPYCGGAVTNLSGAVACVDCTTELDADCADAVAVPAVASYPPECNQNGTPAPTMTATPAPTSTASTPVVTLTTTATMTPLATVTPVPTATSSASTPGLTATPTRTPTPTAPIATATATLTLPLPTVTVPLPTVTVPVPTVTLPLPTVTVPPPTVTLPLPTVTLPLPTATATPVAPVCGNGIVEAGEACELPGVGCSGLLPVCLLCLQCVGL